VEFLRGVQSRFEKENGDLMLVTDYAGSSYLQEEALPAMDCVLCAGRSHALAKAKRVSLAQLQEHVELSVQHSSEEQGYDRHLFGCERAFFLSSHHTKKEALLMGVGFGWMPLYLVHEELKSGALREVKYQGGSWYRFTPRLVHRADRQLGRAGQQFISLLRKSAWPRPTVLRRRA
jgi:DNA-binding transcriptional LysR family regulator